MGKIAEITRTKEEAQASYDRLSRWYDRLETPFEHRYVTAGLTKLGVGTGERVLEIGFGTGEALLFLARSTGETGSVFGIDISPGMTAVAKTKIARAGLSPRVKLIHGDAASLPYDDNFFDAVFMSFTLELFRSAEIPVVLRECFRVLRGGGRLGIVAMSNPDNHGITTRLYLWFHHHFPKYADCRPIYVREEIVGAGFNVIDVTGMRMWGLPVDIVLARKG